MGKEGKYPSMYFMNNSGGAKLREISPGEYFIIMQPNHEAVGQGSATYKHAMLFKDTDRNKLERQVNEFLEINGECIDTAESDKLVQMISGYKSDMPAGLVDGKEIAEITGKTKRYDLPIAKSLKRTFLGPEERARWCVYDKEPSKNTHYSNDKKPSPLSYVWWG